MRGAAAGHAALDRAVDKCHRPADFPSDRARVEYLFQLYEHLTAPLAPTGNPKRPARPRRTIRLPLPAGENQRLANGRDFAP